MTTSCRWPQAEAHFQASRSLLAYDRYLEERQARRFPIDECVLELLTRANDRKGGVSGSRVNLALGLRDGIEYSLVTNP
jgi:nucleotidyltransferase/DNA polymerase involved in DNA repair